MIRLTTITPYWQRPEMLRTWLRALAGATHPEVRHLVYCVGEPVQWLREWMDGYPCQFISMPGDKPGHLSIGHYHNMGATIADSEWIMKLDLDALPNVNYFAELLKVLDGAGPRDWFNGGMVYVSRVGTLRFLAEGSMPITELTYRHIMSQRELLTGYMGPAASNFVCRRQTYLDLGGCDSRFLGYGWEDYQQLYMLERHRLGVNPLSGRVDERNVTQRCRDEISRPRALDLSKRSEWLCLLHHWHPKAPISPVQISANRKVLLDYICNYDQRRPLDSQV